MECYICLESNNDLFKICSCSACVHKECFLKLVKNTNHTKCCPICKYEYQIRETKNIIKYKFEITFCIILFFSYLIFSAFLSISIYIFISFTSKVFNTLIFIGALFILMVSFLIPISAHYFLHQKFKRYCCFNKIIQSNNHIVITNMNNNIQSLIEIPSN